MIQDFTRTPLGFFPTPVQKLDRLRATLGEDRTPEIFIKRDDLTGLATGGNKARKLEFLLTEAIKQSCDTLITSGALQSNHARQTAAAAKACGMDAVLVLSDHLRDDDYLELGNRLIDNILDSRIILTDFESTPPDVAMQAVADQLTTEGRRPFVVPVGGSSPLGSLGYANCITELMDQGDLPDYLVHASGSGGTQSGLLAGLAMTENLENTQVIGISVARKAQDLQQLVYGLANDTLMLLNANVSVPIETVVTDDRFIGGAYGEPTQEMVEAVELVARTEGILLDPVYTGKAMAGLIALIRQSAFAPNEKVMFLHTGGSAALSAYRKSFSRPLEAHFNESFPAGKGQQ